VGSTRVINKVAWVPCCHAVSQYCLLGSWCGQRLLWPSVWPTGQITWLAVSTDNPPIYPSTSPLLSPIHPLYIALMILQAVFKTSLKTSQSNQHCPTLFLVKISHGYYVSSIMKLSIMLIHISNLYFGISQNSKKAYIEGFPKSGHIYYFFIPIYINTCVYINLLKSINYSNIAITLI